jgi:hypothetical protein
MAVPEWDKLRDGEHVGLERALGAYDMFVLHDREGDFDDVGCNPLSLTNLLGLDANQDEDIQTSCWHSWRHSW